MMTKKMKTKRMEEEVGVAENGDLLDEDEEEEELDEE